MLNEKKITKKQIIDPKNFTKFVNNLKKGKIIIDTKTCSLFFETIIKKKFNIIKKEDPIYF